MPDGLNPYEPPLAGLEKQSAFWKGLFKSIGVTLSAIVGTIFFGFGSINSFFLLNGGRMPLPFWITALICMFMLTVGFICFEFAIRFAFGVRCRNGMFFPTWAITAISIPCFITLLGMLVVTAVRFFS